MNSMVVVFGTVCLDRIRRVPYLPGPGGFVEIAEEQILLGGEAANTANALQRWGAKVVLCGNGVANDEDGRTLKGLLLENGFPAETPGSGQEPYRTPVCDVYVTPDGVRTMFGKGFSDLGAVVDPALIPYVPGSWFTAEPNMGQVPREAVRQAATAGMKIYTLDFFKDDEPVGPGQIWQSSTDWVGAPGDVEANLAWVRQWVERHGCFTIVTDGHHGLVAGSPEIPVRAYPSFPNPQPVDSTGAGDVFRAGMLFGFESQWPMSRCLAFASAAACLKCSSLGGTSYVPGVEEVEAFLCAHESIASQY